MLAKTIILGLGSNFLQIEDEVMRLLGLTEAMLAGAMGSVLRPCPLSAWRSFQLKDEVKSALSAVETDQMSGKHFAA